MAYFYVCVYKLFIYIIQQQTSHIIVFLNEYLLQIHQIHINFYLQIHINFYLPCGTSAIIIIFGTIRINMLQLVNVENIKLLRVKLLREQHRSYICADCFFHYLIYHL